MEKHDTFKKIFEDMREPWWNEDIIQDNDTDTDRKLEAESRRNKLGRRYKTFPNQAFVEVCFCMVQIMFLAWVAQYLVIGFTLTGWVSSVNSILQEDQSETPSIFNETLVNNGSYDMDSIGTVYILYAICLLILILLTIRTTFIGTDTNVKYYFLANIVGFVFELIFCIIAKILAPEKSCKMEKFEVGLKTQMMWYGMTNAEAIIGSKNITRFLGFEAIMKMNSIQEALGCCGVHGFLDYTSINNDPAWFPNATSYTTRDNTTYRPLSDTTARHRELDTIPNTCCKPEWMNNIYCAEEFHNATMQPFVIKRLSDFGCLEAAHKLCENILYILNNTTEMLIIFRALFLLIGLGLLHFVLRLWNIERAIAFDALIMIQRPTLPGFDLVQGMLKLKPILGKTQALPGQERPPVRKDHKSVTAKRKHKEVANTTHESIWEEVDREERRKSFKDMTKKQHKMLKGILKEELEGVPESVILAHSQKLKEAHQKPHKEKRKDKVDVISEKKSKRNQKKRESSPQNKDKEDDNLNRIKPESSKAGGTSRRPDWKKNLFGDVSKALSALLSHSHHDADSSNSSTSSGSESDKDHRHHHQKGKKTKVDKGKKENLNPPPSLESQNIPKTDEEHHPIKHPHHHKDKHKHPPSPTGSQNIPETGEDHPMKHPHHHKDKHKHKHPSSPTGSQNIPETDEEEHPIKHPHHHKDKHKHKHSPSPTGSQSIPETDEEDHPTKHPHHHKDKHKHKRHPSPTESQNTLESIISEVSLVETDQFLDELIEADIAEEKNMIAKVQGLLAQTSKFEGNQPAITRTKKQPRQPRPEVSTSSYEEEATPKAKKKRRRRKTTTKKSKRKSVFMQPSWNQFW